MNNTIVGALIGSIVPAFIGIIGAIFYIAGLGSDVELLDTRVTDLRELPQEVDSLQSTVTGLLGLERQVGDLEDSVSQLLSNPALSGSPRATEVPATAAQEPSAPIDFVSGRREPGTQMTFTNGGPWGRWSDPVFCPPDHYVCGLQQKVEAPIDGDDSAMNAVAFYCCPLNPN